MRGERGVFCCMLFASLLSCKSLYHHHQDTTPCLLCAACVCNMCSLLLRCCVILIPFPFPPPSLSSSHESIRETKSPPLGFPLLFLLPGASACLLVVLMSLVTVYKRRESAQRHARTKAQSARFTHGHPSPIDRPPVPVLGVFSLCSCRLHPGAFVFPRSCPLIPSINET